MTDFELLRCCNGCNKRLVGCHSKCETWSKRQIVAEKIRNNKKKYKSEEYNGYTQEKIRKNLKNKINKKESIDG